jgi:hypothetical protein
MHSLNKSQAVPGYIGINMRDYSSDNNYNLKYFFQKYIKIIFFHISISKHSENIKKI